jgi:hypothetical protein
VTGLASVSCASRRVCVAVGTIGLQTGVMAWDGSRWSTQPAPVLRPGPDGGGAELLGVSCTSKTACMAVGDADSPCGGVPDALVERWNGERWSIIHSPNPFGGSNYCDNPGNVLNDVSCTSSSACTVVAGDAGVGQPPFAEHWNGARWKLDNLPSEFVVNAVSCTSRVACTAVGDGESYPPPPTMSFATLLAAGWNGRRWTVELNNPLPGPPGSYGELDGVSCPSRNTCVAVGDDTPLSPVGGPVPLVARES